MKPSDFIARLMEVCGTSETAELARCIGVSYQTMKNYMPPTNRVPASDLLLQITEKTNASIHWLLTGKGSKIAATEEIPADKVFVLELPQTTLKLRVIAVENATRGEIPLFRATDELLHLPDNDKISLADRLLKSIPQQNSPQKRPKKG